MSRSDSAADFRLRGPVSVRLVGATPDQLGRFARWAPAEACPPVAAPDLIVRVLARGAPPVDSGVPFDSLGRGGELHWPRTLPRSGLLRPILNLIALSRGLLPVHAAGFRLDGGTLVTGASGAGKTGALLAGLAGGAGYLCAEWAMLDGEPRTIHGAREHVRVRPWHLRQWPALRGRVAWGRRVVLSGAELAGRLPRAAGHGRRVAEALRRRAHVDMDPGQLTDEGRILGTAPLTRCLLLERGQTSSTEPLGLEEATASLVRSSLRDFRELTRRYAVHRQSFPQRRNALLERLDAELTERFARALRGVRLHRVALPAAPTSRDFDETWRALTGDERGPAPAVEG